ncbi:MAG: MFS transporter [Bacteroidota bacterium]|nr:MFS transporter [Bacteroidota bacterium]
MRRILNAYSQLEEHVLLMIKAEFFIQIIGAAFFLILNIFLSKSGFSDPQIANLLSYRFLAVMVLGFPLGMFIKGRPLKPFFWIGSFGVPTVAIGMILAINLQVYILLPYLFVLWGVVFTCFQVCSLPYIMRNTSIENQSYAISLNYATHSFGTIVSSLLIFVLTFIFNQIDEGVVLTVVSFSGLIGIYYLYQLKVDKVINKNEGLKWKSYNWGLVVKAVVPTIIISIGAGLTIPFINLFFYHDFGIDSSEFALIGGGASVLVAFMALLVPKVKDVLGFKVGITLTQSIAVIALVALATTEFFVECWWALPLAIFCYWLRTPLMNMAAPMTSELTMNYVGKNNQEIFSAITAAIWSGSWFFSSQIFRFLKAMDLPFAYIFYITAALYAVGVFSYYLLILDYEKKLA